jgi:hypothetical protein
MEWWQWTGLAMAGIGAAITTGAVATFLIMGVKRTRDHDRYQRERGWMWER